MGDVNGNGKGDGNGGAGKRMKDISSTEEAELYDNYFIELYGSTWTEAEVDSYRKRVVAARKRGEEAQELLESV